MSDFVTIRAIVGTEPQLTITATGVAVLKFRAATHESKRDADTGQWSDGPTSWYSVSAFRALAENAMESIRQGDHLVIHGKLQIRQFDRADGTRGTSADVEALALGHDLKFGTSAFTKVRAPGAEAQRAAHEDGSQETAATWPPVDAEAA